MGIPIKTPEEIQAMIEGGQILGYVLEETLKIAKPGVSTFELDEFAENLIKEKDAKAAFKGYHGFPGTLCTAIDEVIVHGIPKKTDILQEGDLLTIDCGVIWKNMYTDAARSIGIGEISQEKQQLLDTSKEALNAAINLARPGNHLNFIGKKIEEIVNKAGFKIIYDLTGHGIGKELHEKPIVLNYWEGNPGPILKEGMTIAIEPIFSTGTHKMKTLDDNWTIVTADNSISVQEENTILITQNNPTILTKTKDKNDLHK